MWGRGRRGSAPKRLRSPLQVRTYFPPACCHLLPVNSAAATAPVGSAPLPDPWAGHVAEPLFSSAGRSGGASAALLAGAAVPGLRGCLLSAADRRAIADTLSRVLAAGVIPEAERRLTKLAGAAAQVRASGLECFLAALVYAASMIPHHCRRAEDSVTLSGPGGAAAAVAADPAAQAAGPGAEEVLRRSLSPSDPRSLAARPRAPVAALVVAGAPRRTRPSPPTS